MSEIQKCPYLARGWGATFFKNVPNSKMSQRSEGGGGGGVNPNRDIVPNFLDFYFDASPKVSNCIC